MITFWDLCKIMSNCVTLPAPVVVKDDIYVAIFYNILLEMHSKIVAVLIKKDNSANFTRYFTDIFAKHYNALVPFVTLASKMPPGCYYALPGLLASSRCCIHCSNLANFLLWSCYTLKQTPFLWYSSWNPKGVYRGTKNASQINWVGHLGEV